MRSISARELTYARYDMIEGDPSRLCQRPDKLQYPSIETKIVKQSMTQLMTIANNHPTNAFLSTMQYSATCNNMPCRRRRRRHHHRHPHHQITTLA